MKRINGECHYDGIKSDEAETLYCYEIGDNFIELGYDFTDVSCSQKKFFFSKNIVEDSSFIKFRKKTSLVKAF